jgi:hypothetical protein
MQAIIKLLALFVCAAISQQALSFDPREGKIPIQLGFFGSSEGKAQNINIKGLIGDRYTVRSSSNQNVLVGLGYFLNGPEEDWFKIAYGINAFYLASTTVKGYVVQEQLFPNLSYQYNVTNVPIYIAAKGEIPDNNQKYALTLDLGIGPNVVTTSNYHTNSLDGGITIPEKLFSGKTTTSFSAMAGIGIKVNNVLGQIPLECGYRFFYLGAGSFNTLNSQVINSLETGNGYANALVCSATIL